MRYKKGDKVRVKENLEINKMYGRYDFIFDMSELKGKEVIISNVYSDCYRLDGYSYSWTDEMLEETDNCKWVFNIEEFKNKDIAVNCTREESEIFFEILNNNGINKWKYDKLKVKEYTCYDYVLDEGIDSGLYGWYSGQDFTIYKFSEIDFSQVWHKESIDNVSLNKHVDKYTFREIIANIKEGEKWTDGITNISMNNCKIRIEDFNGSSEASYTYGENYREFIKIKETKQVTICKVNYTANSDKLKEFALNSNDKVVEGEIVECDANIGNSGWQYARIKEIEIKELTENEFIKYKVCRKLS